MEDNCSEFVSSPTQVIDLIITIFKIKLIAMIMKAIDYPKIKDFNLSAKYDLQIADGVVFPLIYNEYTMFMSFFIVFSSMQ